MIPHVYLNLIEFNSASLAYNLINSVYYRSTENIVLSAEAIQSSTTLVHSHCLANAQTITLTAVRTSKLTGKPNKIQI